MSRDKTKWVSQMVSTKTRKMLEEICKTTRRSVPTELEIIVEENYKKIKK
jgi:hypothetical protein